VLFPGEETDADPRRRLELRVQPGAELLVLGSRDAAGATVNDQPVLEGGIVAPGDEVVLPDFDARAEGFEDAEQLRDNNTPESELEGKQIAAVVNKAMEALPDDLRTAITLREIEGLSYEEIADVMNCPIGTVRSRIFRAREAIATELRPLLGTEENRRW